MVSSQPCSLLNISCPGGDPPLVLTFAALSDSSAYHTPFLSCTPIHTALILAQAPFQELEQWKSKPQSGCASWLDRLWGMLTSSHPRAAVPLLSVVLLQVAGTEAQERALHVFTECRPTHRQHELTLVHVCQA